MLLFFTSVRAAHQQIKSLTRVSSTQTLFNVVVFVINCIYIMFYSNSGQQTHHHKNFKYISYDYLAKFRYLLGIRMNNIGSPMSNLDILMF